MNARLPLNDEEYLASLRGKVAEAVNGKFQSYVLTMGSSPTLTIFLTTLFFLTCSHLNTPCCDEQDDANSGGII